MEQREKLTHLMRSVQAGRIVHALLFAGPAGTGKRTAAKWLAQAIMCTGQDRPCGACPACRQVEQDSHPDVHVIRPEKNLIRIDQIRALVTQVGLTPYASDMHIAIIEQADSMNANAQNALLKTLETPAGNAMFILLAERTSSLLPTVVSRCQLMRFSPLSQAECARVLEGRGVPPERARLLAGYAEGSVGRALDMDGDEDYMALRTQALESIEKLREGADVLTCAAPLVAGKGNEAALLDIFELWARDLMAVQNGSNPFEQAEEKRLNASRIDGRLMLMGVLRARRQLKSNVSWRSVLETMFFGLLAQDEHRNTSNDISGG